MHEVTQKHSKADCEEGTRTARVPLPMSLHRKVTQHKYDLTGKRGYAVSIPEAIRDLLEKATRKIKPVQHEKV